ncbi:MAG TPA: YafY family protein [Telluria sp.]|jgi:predicted DNA-binding transcriptional regulator YafY
MSRSERLLALLQVLRRYHTPVSGHALARDTGVSIRTLYRDINSLRAQGAPIEGEPGIGYIMKHGFMLPPMMFALQELEALVLGMRLVAEQGDNALAQGARTALDKISAVLPAQLRRELDASALLVGAGRQVHAHAVDIDLLRRAIRNERKLRLTYRTAEGTMSERIVWPYALVYFDLTRVLMCWCELRGAFRNFRTDRIGASELLEERYPKNRQTLLAEWRRSEFVAGRSILPESNRP